MARPNGPELDLRKLGYEIAEPTSYDSFSDAKVLSGTMRDGGTEVRSHESEPWDDSKRKGEPGVTRPETGQYDSSKFESPKRESWVSAEGSSIRATRAVWIVHGMGEQIPFETVSSLAYGLLQSFQDKARAAGRAMAPLVPRLRTVKIGDEVLQRVELDVQGDQGAYELHLYESYWAPKTEGVAKIRDVVAFLWDGGTRGLLNCVHAFRRAMFGGMAEFVIPFRSAIWILLTLAVLAALTAINGIIAAAAAAQLNVPALSNLVSRWEALAAIASCMTAIAFSFGTLLFLADVSKPKELAKPVRLIVSVLAWLGFLGTLSAIIKSAAWMLLIVNTAKMTSDLNAGGILAHIKQCMAPLFEVPAVALQGFSTLVILACAVLVGLAMLLRAILRSNEGTLRGNGLLVTLFILGYPLHLVAVFGPAWIWYKPTSWPGMPPHFGFLASSWWVWPFLIALSAKIREVMVQYVGDVAIYVTANKLNRFDEVRSQIKETARTVAASVYLACKPGTREFLYDQIAIVGHSLGSVIAYDTLNRLMLDDWLAAHQLRVDTRTRAFVTFGSPLNKTAFFFTIQGSDSMHIRERLAATVQPLIQSYPKFRKLKWINVHSWNDIISGPLSFYDLPGLQKQRPLPRFAIENIIDKDAAVPLAAHVDYWKNKCVWDNLREQIAP